MESSTEKIEPEKRGVGETANGNAPILPVTDSPIHKIVTVGMNRIETQPARRLPARALQGRRVASHVGEAGGSSGKLWSF